MIWALNPTQQHIKCNYTQLHGFNPPSTPSDEGAPFSPQTRRLEVKLEKSRDSEMEKEVKTIQGEVFSSPFMLLTLCFPNKPPFKGPESETLRKPALGDK